MKTILLLPRVLGTYVPEERVSKPVKTKTSKYDHKKMLEDRISGMTWDAIGEKHGVTSKSNLGNTTRHIVMNSKASHDLTPKQIEKLFDKFEF